MFFLQATFKLDIWIISMIWQVERMQTHTKSAYVFNGIVCMPTIHNRVSWARLLPLLAGWLAVPWNSTGGKYNFIQHSMSSAVNHFCAYDHLLQTKAQELHTHIQLIKRELTDCASMKPTSHTLHDVCWQTLKSYEYARLIPFNVSHPAILMNRSRMHFILIRIKAIKSKGL